MFYPENMEQLKAFGMMNMGLNMLEASGPSRIPNSFGQVVGQAGGKAMRNTFLAGQQVQKQQAQQAEMQRRQQAAQALEGYARQAQMGSASAAGPLEAQTSLAVDMAAENVMRGKAPEKFMYEGILGIGDQTGTGKATKSADESLLYRMSVGRHGGLLDEQGNLRSTLDDKTYADVQSVTAIGARLYANGQAGRGPKLTRAEALEKAYTIHHGKPPPPDQTPDPFGLL